ncbi:MAG: aldo/keto reductase [Candidatus Odinarchaeota archaeon]|nr:aldo/keto reductase [Candidatus Odinarchaeota archaeon]
MEYTTLGKTNIKISKIGIGTWQWGTKSWDYGKTYTKEDLKKAFNTAIEAGITFFDTAEIYGGGKSEELLGDFAKDVRDEIVIASKVFAHHLLYKSVIKACKSSLERLKTDYLDLYQVHWPNPLIPMKSTASAMDFLVDEGLVRSVGVSNFSLKRMIKFDKLLQHNLASNQVRYGILHRNIEKELLPYALEHKITVIAYSPLDQGATTGKYDDQYLPKDRVRRISFIFTPTNMKRIRPLIGMINELAKTHDVEPVNVILRYIINKGAVPIVGVKKQEYVESLIRTFEFNLSEREMKSIDFISAKIKIAKLRVFPSLLKRLIKP